MFSRYPTKLSLDRFMEIVGIHPYSASQLRIPAIDGAPSRSIGCSQAIFQHRHQSGNGTPGREDIGRAIFRAEALLERTLHFNLLKGWMTEQLPLTHLAYDPPRPTKLDRCYFIEPAARATTLIEEGAQIGEDDLDGDNYAETATVEFTIDATMRDSVNGNLEEFRLFSAEKGPDPAWEIRPVKVSASSNGLDITISFSMAQLVDPTILEQMIPDVLDPEDSGVMVDSVDVYRVYSSKVMTDCLVVTCRSDDGVVTAGDSSQSRVWVEDKVGSVVRVLRRHHWPAGCGCRNPVEMLSYANGWPRSTFTVMDPHMEEAVVALVMAELGSLCPCTQSMGYGDFDRDMTLTAHSVQSGQDGTHDRWATVPSPRIMKNPFGQRYGQHVAWDLICDDIIGEAMNEYVEIAPTQIIGYGGPRWGR